MSALNNRAVLITGGSGGIGFALAKVFAQNGNNIVLVARNEQALTIASEELQKNYGITCWQISCDLSMSGSPEILYGRIQELGLRIDVLVNNAGFGTWGDFSGIELQEELKEIQLNMATLMHLSKLCIREMLERGNGKILNVSSTAGFQPGPMMAVYYASKAFVTSFSEALYYEFKDRGVVITALCPGPTATDFQRHAGMAKLHLFRKIFMMKPDIVAQKGYQGLMNGKRIVVPGIVNKIVSVVTRLLPHSLVLNIVYSLHKKRG